MSRKNVQLKCAVAVIVGACLAALAILIVFSVATNQFVVLPIALLLVFVWGGMFFLQVVLPIVAVFQTLAWLNRKLFSQA